MMKTLESMRPNLNVWPPPMPRRPPRPLARVLQDVCPNFRPDGNEFVSLRNRLARIRQPKHTH